jgi:hypothetical protein
MDDQSIGAGKLKATIRNQVHVGRLFEENRTQRSWRVEKERVIRLKKTANELTIRSPKVRTKRLNKMNEISYGDERCGDLCADKLNDSAVQWVRPFAEYI